MKFKKFGSKLIVRIDKGEEILETLKNLCVEQDIKLGVVSGIGAVNKIKIGLFETEKKIYYSTEFTGDYEIAALNGNISTQNNEIYLHLHICLSDRYYQVYGGHLNMAVVSATAEVIIDIMEGQVDRNFSEEIGLNLLKFEE